MEYEKSYIFEPEDTRPAKRRRTAPEGLQASWYLRKKVYREAWKRPRERIDEKLQSINATTVKGLVAFLDDALAAPSDSRIPTGLILAGANSAPRTSIASQVAAHAQEGIRRIFVSLSSNTGTNLKAVLKTVIQKATSRSSADDDEELEELSSTRKGPKLLNYDLQALYDFVQDRQIQQVVIAIEDTEAFDSHVLSELIELFGCWQGRMSFAFLLNIATSVDFLQQRLSKGAVRSLAGRLFDAALSGEEVEEVFDALVEPDNTIFLGAGLIAMMLERQTDYIQSIDSFIQSAQHAFMSCFYANALSLFLDPDVAFEDVPTDHFEALRNLPSFRSHAQALLDNGSTQEVRKLLHSDQYMYTATLELIEKGRQAVRNMLVGISVVQTLQRCLPNGTVSARSSLYVQAMSGKLAASPLARSILLSLRKAPSNIALQAVKEILSVDGATAAITSDLLGIAKELDDLIRGREDTNQPLRSEDDIKNSTLRTTVIAQKVELSKQKSTLSEQDAAYTKVVRRLSDVLELYFETHLIDPKQLGMHELFVYDLKSPYREVFTPRPRGAIERALTAPHDYLDCDCCRTDQENGSEATLASSQPATAILYQLYLESGILINASDLWQAFHAVIGDADEDDQKTMALFQRALAELRYLGCVKSTRKRVDHIAKVAWKGL